MEGVNGVDLATKMTADRPALKVLLISPFTDGMLVLNEGWHFLPKPFISSQLRSLITGLVYPDKPSTFSKKASRCYEKVSFSEQTTSRHRW
jgi:hypothetical protein